jgi:hypothetical protein
MPSIATPRTARIAISTTAAQTSSFARSRAGPVPPCNPGPLHPNPRGTGALIVALHIGASILRNSGREYQTRDRSSVASL